jgi:hypothetical protein
MPFESVRNAVFLLCALWAASSDAAEVKSKLSALKCDATPVPVTPIGPDGYGVFGEVELQVGFSEGRVVHLEPLSGRIELLEAVKTALDGYRCDASAPPVRVPMLFEFINEWEKKALSLPLHDARTRLAASNRIVRRYFPTRFDAIHAVAHAQADGYAAPRPLDVARPELDSVAAKLGGTWIIEFNFIVEADGNVSHIAAKGISPALIHPRLVRIGIDALKKSRFEAATYKGQALPVAMAHQMTLKLD